MGKRIFGGGGGGERKVKGSCVWFKMHITQPTKKNGIINSDKNKLKWAHT
jgi:hypothetical protein